MKIFFLLIATLMPSSVLACTQIQQPDYNAANYYAAAYGLTGTALKLSLNNMIKDHTRYDYSPCTWEILKQADQHPSEPDSVIGIYTRRAILKSNQDRGGNTPDFWNREHVWPKGHGFPNKSQHAYTDTHMLRASDKSVNADRGNSDFAVGGVQHHECSGCTYTSNTWEPPDEVKGDIGRIMFYMVVRYEAGDNSATPDLELVDSLTSSDQALMGDLCDLVQWHISDPVSASEQQRNNIIYDWQGNRNPFIDHPEYVIPIWGEQCGIKNQLVDNEDIPFPLWMNLMIIVSIIVSQYLFKKHKK